MSQLTVNYLSKVSCVQHMQHYGLVAHCVYLFIILTESESAGLFTKLKESTKVVIFVVNKIQCI